MLPAGWMPASFRRFACQPVAAARTACTVTPPHLKAPR
ncbi:hypothetical protein C7S14_3025 [Burkholderia cepacia]|nr:hypothetical protein C7S14_3025 [Burkholderia cepacia]